MKTHLLLMKLGPNVDIQLEMASLCRTSGAHVRPKEAILICLALSLLVFSGRYGAAKDGEKSQGVHLFIGTLPQLI